jgi:hypothetical protein
MDTSKFEVCQLCGKCNETVMDGICEPCEPIWFEQIGILSKQLDGNTTLVELFDKAGKNAKEQLHKDNK